MIKIAALALFTVVAARGQIAPVIVAQPTSQHIAIGGTATFSVVAEGTPPFTYAWFKGLGTTPIATTSALTITNATASDSTVYTVRVTNVGGSVTGIRADLDVIPIEATAPRWSGNSAGSGGETGNPPPLSSGLAGSLYAGSSYDLRNSFLGQLPMTFQWTRDGVPLTGETQPSLYASNMQLAETGTYVVTATNALGSASSLPFTITVLPYASPPRILATPPSRRVAAGSPVSFTVTAYGEAPFTYAWEFNGAPLPGVTGPTLLLNNAAFTDAGRYRCRVGNARGTGETNPIFLTLNSPPRLSNLSVRTAAGSGPQTLIVGFVVGNPLAISAQFLLIRASGPALASFGVANTLLDPRLDVYSNGRVLSSNDNWSGQPATIASASQVGAFPWLDPASRDAALVTSFSRGSYSAQVSAAAGSSPANGIVLAELYDSGDSTTDTPRLTNVSARSQVSAGDGILIAGFSITGGPRTVLIRAIGPSLVPFGVTGVLLNPKLELFSASTKIGENDDWNGPAELKDAFTAVGAFPLNSISKDSALLVTLPPGSYTAQVSGVGNTTGVALIEVYEVP